MRTVSFSRCKPLHLLLEANSPAIKRVRPGDDVGAVSANQEVDALVEGLQSALARGDLGLLDDVQGVRRAHTQGRGVAGGLQTAVRVHAIHQTICTSEEEGEDEGGRGRGGKNARSDQ